MRGYLICPFEMFACAVRSCPFLLFAVTPIYRKHQRKLCKYFRLREPWRNCEAADYLRPSRTEEGEGGVGAPTRFDERRFYSRQQSLDIRNFLQLVSLSLHLRMHFRAVIQRRHQPTILLRISSRAYEQDAL